MRQALIIGGGIAGPVTAMALQRVGIEPVIFEAHDDTPTEVGSYFTVTTNGLDALRAIDADGIAIAAGFPTYANVLWNQAGRPLGRVPLGAPLDDGTTGHTIKRARLSRQLRDEAARRGITVHGCRRLVHAETVPGGGVVARFDDGSEASGDLLIGADGIHSVTRRMIDPHGPAVRYLGLTNFGGYTHDAGLDVEPGVWHLIFGRRAFFGYNVDPTGGVVWFANVPRPEISAAERAATDDDAWRARLLDRFADDAGPAVDLIGRGVLELSGDDMYDLPHVPTWHRGPMIVIGDAAHAPSPSSGQGASMAMEDAVVLAKALRDEPDAARAYATYEALRRDRVERIVAQGARSSSSKTPGPMGRLVRDTMLKLVFRYVVTERSLAWMYDYRVDWATPVQGATSAG
jgi:2-polyprenyl-6-methoxyphenol hydroxylase-like FAD-dependent oxidoreductase